MFSEITFEYESITVSFPEKLVGIDINPSTNVLLIIDSPEDGINPILPKSSTLQSIIWLNPVKSSKKLKRK